jgi:hypothetical protein
MRKNAAIVVIICLLCNGFMPKAIGLPERYDAFCSFIQNQPLLQYYFSLSSLPINIVNKLLCDNTASAEKRSQNKNDSNRANTSAEYSLVSMGKSITEGKSFLQRISPCHGAVFSDGHSHAYVCCDHGCLDIQDSANASTGTPGGSIFLFIIVMLFILLPRGSINENGAMRIYRICKNPVWKNPNWVFLLGGIR